MPQLNFDHPILLISLDFELHWGRFDKYEVEDYQSYYQNTLEVVPQFLELFEKYGIHATWATVGSLLAENWEEWEEYAPEIKPEFENQKYSAYEWAKNRPQHIGLFAPQLVKSVSKTPGQEIGSHTFAHYYTGLKGANIESFKADLIASKKITEEKLGVTPVSLVFPRNQYNPSYISSARDLGFSNFRTNPSDWFWENTAEETLVKKIFRTGDTLVPLGKRTSFTPFRLKNGEIPASRLLRPFRKGSVFNQIRINRIKSELITACQHNETYHLWWHPHNFGFYPEENLSILNQLLEFIQELKAEKGLISMNMNEYSGLFNSNLNLSPDNWVK